MTFDEWLMVPHAYDEPRYVNIRDFVGPTRYPGVVYWLRAAYNVGYEAGKSGTEDLMGSG